MATQDEIEAAAKAIDLGRTEYDRSEDIAKAALEAAERARWQPIETAPRKQHEQIIVVKSDGFCKIVEWDCDQWWDGEAGWDDDDFTHWQPLPSPPEDK